jgi:hypothetical protein
VQKINGAIAIVLFLASVVLLVSELDLTFLRIDAQSSPPKLLANLTDDSHNWKPFGSTNVSQVNGNLTISITTDSPQKIFNRAFLQTQVNSSVNAPTFLNFDYASKHLLYPSSKPMFVIEIRGGDSGEILWTSFLNDTSGKVLNETFLLPSNVVNKPTELRLYIITQGGPSHSVLSLKNIQLLENNKEIAAHFLDTKRLVSFSINTENKTYAPRYDIHGARLNGIKVDESHKAIEVKINSATNGMLVIELPRDLIDAKKQSNIDAPYLVLVDGKSSVTNEIASSNLTRILAIEFKQDNKDVEIQGNQIAGLQ